MLAVAKYSNRTVFAALDPWLYNKYTDSVEFPASYNNYVAGKELVRWILKQVPR